MTNYFFSVIVPVFHDEENLHILLAHLSQQTYSPEFFEIIVIDNAGTMNTENYLRYSNVKIHTEIATGPYAARNKGICVSKGEIMAFTDADCIPSPDWLQSANKYLNDHPDCTAFGGQIKTSFKNPLNQGIIELYDFFMGLKLQKQWIENEKYAATANFFIKKMILKKIGLFDPSLMSGGDAEMGNRIHKNGFIIEYAKEVIITHPTLNSLRSLIHKRLRDTIGTLKTIEKYNYSKRNMLTYIYFQLIKRPKDLLCRMKKSSLKIVFWKKAAILLLFFIIKALQFFERIRVRIAGCPLR